MKRKAKMKAQRWKEFNTQGAERNSELMKLSDHESYVEVEGAGEAFRL